MPIGIVARKARHFETKHEPNVGERNLSSETRKPVALSWIEAPLQAVSAGTDFLPYQ
jgi:hypothetical protein